MTAQELMKASLRVLGVIGRGRTPGADLLNDTFEALKIMLRGLSIEPGGLYKIDIESFNLDGSNSYTIGDGGDFDTVRPVNIVGGYTSSSTVDYPLEIIGERKYRNLQFKDDMSGYALYLWYNPTYGATKLGEVYIYPPDDTTLTINTLQPLGEPDGITDDVIFPPEYDGYIKWNLAIEIAPEHGKEPSRTTIANAARTKDEMEKYHRSFNIEPVRIDMINSPPNGGSQSNNYITF